jgi:serine phosphatase RsbU (regulator of sigma subunit)
VTQDPVRAGDAVAESDLLPLLQAVCEQSPTGLLVFDTDLRYVLVNPQMAAMANTPAEVLLGRSVRDAFPEYEPLTVRVEHVLATGEPLVAFDVTGSVPGEVARHHVWSLSAFRLVDDQGTVLGVAVTSTEVTAARALERDREALATRLELLAASGELLSGELDERATVEGVLTLVVPSVAEWASLHLLDETDGTIRLAALRHAEPAAQPLLERVLGAFQVTMDQPFGAGRVIATGRAEDLPQLTDEMLVALAGGDQQALAGFRRLRVSHGAVVPLAARGRTFGALSMSLPPEEPPAAGALDEAGKVLIARQEVVSDVAARAALALDNARLFAHQYDVAVTLQRSLLPRTLPPLVGWDIAAAYLPGAAGTEVGGDFYEAFVGPDGRLVVAIGDVMGRGVRAAAVMGQVRAVLRGYVLEGHAPAATLSRLNVMVSAMEDSSIVTCLVGMIDLASGDGELACAGHVPPLLVDPSNDCRAVRLDPGPPLGVQGVAYGTTSVRLAPEATLVLFTDGLVEARDQPVDDGIHALCLALSEVPHLPERPVTADELCKTAVEKMGRGQQVGDDVAVLVIRRSSTPGDGGDSPAEQPSR